jgi:hypothetical protein
MIDPRTPVTDMERLGNELARMQEVIQSLASPSGTQRVASVSTLQRTVDYLASLRTVALNGSSISDYPVPKDATWRYQATNAVISNFEIPTGHAIIRASCSRVGIVPAGAYVEGGIGFEIVDANGNVPSGYGRASTLARLWTDRAMAMPLVTPDTHFFPNPTVNPGPYTITAWIAGWAASTNTVDVDIDFAYSTIYAQVFGSGVPTA